MTLTIIEHAADCCFAKCYHQKYIGSYHNQHNDTKQIETQKNSKNYYEV